MRDIYSTLLIGRHDHTLWFDDVHGSPQVTYHGTTTVVKWPDGTYTSAKPCKAGKGIKADKFDPTIGVLHCIAKKYVPEYKKIIAEAQVQE